MAQKRSYPQAKLPKRLDKALAHVNWEVPDVLVGALRNRQQLDVSLDGDFYHMPATSIDPEKVKYVAIYQSITLFGRGGGIRWYGKVADRQKLQRFEIEAIPKASDEWYYRFLVKSWRRLTHPIPAGGVAFVHLLTNHFLLRNCRSVARLLIGSEHQFRWFYAVEKALRRTRRAFTKESGFLFDGVLTLVTKNAVLCIRGDKLAGQVQTGAVSDYTVDPLFDLYNQVFPEYAALERQYVKEE